MLRVFRHFEKELGHIRILPLSTETAITDELLRLERSLFLYIVFQNYVYKVCKQA